MAQPPKVEKHGEFGVTSQFVIEVQPLFIRNSFQQFFACVPSYQSKFPFVQTEVGLEQDPDVIRGQDRSEILGTCENTEFVPVAPCLRHI
jgi:hypothetical protein